MADLAREQCGQCRGDAPNVGAAEIAAPIKDLPAWATLPRPKGTIRRLTESGRMTVTWWTHVIGGLHRNDFIMAARTDALGVRSAGG